MTLLKTILNNWKSLSAIASAVTFIWIASAKYEKKRASDEVFQSEVITGVNELKDHASNTDLRLERIEQSLMDQNNQISDMREENKTTRRVLVESVAKNPGFSKEDYDYLINILYDIKKNERDMGEIIIPYRIERIQYNSILSLKN